LRVAPGLVYLGAPAVRAAHPTRPICMAFWKKLLRVDSPKPVDYYEEGEALLADGKAHDALTSFRLALKESPGDIVVLQQIAVCYTRMERADEAAKTYRHVLQKDSSAPGAHYGLAFILLKGDRPEQAIPHLEAFLARAPRGADAGGHVEHARLALAQLREELNDARSEPI
jgi:tetratricopeptide (TPR) repeat protein